MDLRKEIWNKTTLILDYADSLRRASPMCYDPPRPDQQGRLNNLYDEILNLRELLRKSKKENE